MSKEIDWNKLAAELKSVRRTLGYDQHDDHVWRWLINELKIIWEREANERRGKPAQPYSYRDQ